MIEEKKGAEYEFCSLFYEIVKKFLTYFLNKDKLFTS